jgi:hypothetical protein
LRLVEPGRNPRTGMEALATTRGFGIPPAAGKWLTHSIALRSAHDAAMHSTHPEKGHGLRCRPTMSRKQVSRPVDGLDPPIAAAEAEQVE